ncbi:MAG: transporter [Bacillales bacterium]|jgi:DHA3 family macrolide efflux protein-like MFS transporter|nr:transporter [Bacillales bacterium]
MLKQSWFKNVLLYMTSTTTYYLGSFLVQYVIIWHITLKTDSGIMMTISTMCGFLPQMFISLFAGVWADRYDRRKLMTTAFVTNAAASLVLAILFTTGFDAIWLLFVYSVIRSACTGISNPAANALLPSLVPSEDLIKINGLNGTIFSVIQLLSPVFGGLLLGLFPIGPIFFTCVVTTILSIAVLFKVKLPPVVEKHESEQKSVLHDLKMGFVYVKEHLFVKTILIFYAFLMFLIVPSSSLSPLQIKRSFDGGITELTIIEVAFGVGAVIGGMLLSFTGGFKNRIRSISITSMLFGVYSLLLGSVGNFLVYCIIMVILGMTVPFYSSPTVTTIQQSVESDKLGRVMSFYGIIASAAIPVGMMVFGPLADIVKIEYLMLGSGVALIFVGAMMFKNKNLNGHHEIQLEEAI